MPHMPRRVTAPSFPEAIATMEPSSDNDTDRPEWSSAASPSMSMPICWCRLNASVGTLTPTMTKPRRPRQTAAPRRSATDSTEPEISQTSAVHPARSSPSDTSTSRSCHAPWFSQAILRSLRTRTESRTLTRCRQNPHNSGSPAVREMSGRRTHARLRLERIGATAIPRSDIAVMQWRQLRSRRRRRCLVGRVT